MSAPFDKLGVENLNGHHIVIRGYADVEEREVFERSFTELRAEERDVLYRARRRHKTTENLLHELEHNLGANLAADGDTLMYATHSERAAAFDATAASSSSPAWARACGAPSAGQRRRRPRRQPP